MTLTIKEIDWAHAACCDQHRAIVEQARKVPGLEEDLKRLLEIARWADALLCSYDHKIAPMTYLEYDEWDCEAKLREALAAYEAAGATRGKAKKVESE